MDTEILEDDAERVVLSHPLPALAAGYDKAPVHVHHDREVICKKAANEIVIEPMLSHPHRHRYVRTENVDGFGRPIFVEAE